MIIKPRNLSGFADYTEAENVALSEWIVKVEESYRLFGFSRLFPRPVELREVLLSKGGIQKQIFGISRLHNDGATDMALPFDRTVSLAYWVAKHQSEIAFPYKRYDISYSYRGERAQAGRFQGFFQADVDIIGQDSLDSSADSEIINVIYSTLQKIGFQNIYLCINDLNLIRSILQSLNIPNEKHRDVLNIIDSIQKVEKETFLTELKAATPFLGNELNMIWKLFSFEGSLKEFSEIIKEQCLYNEEINRNIENLDNTVNTLSNSGISKENTIYRPSIVRGLDYYTGVVFETFAKGFENLGSIASGGRYDNLSTTFTHQVLPGVGGSIGLTRLFDIAVKNQFISLIKCTESEFFVGFREHSYKTMGMSIANELRKKGYKTDLYSGSGNFKKQLTYADRKGFKSGVFIMAEDSFVVKDLHNKTQVDYKTIDELLQSV